ncbi:MAG: hypothetical protein II214_07770, partial [Alistipes sp.]|nr:hypothetical protein [Alistipes sp.]
MKKIFTLMWAVVCAALTIVSCTPDQGQENTGGETYASTITVTGAPEANLAPAAGELSLGYAITNPTLTDALSVTTEATWVHVGEVSEAAVAITYDANSDAPGAPAREAVIKFAYNGAKDVLVTLKQDSQAPQFAVTFDEATLTCGSASYTCVPVDNEMTYLLASSQDLGQYGVQGETPAEKMQAYLEMLASYGMLIEEYKPYGYWFQGPSTEMPKQATRYSAEESVQVYAVGFSAVPTGEVDEWGAPIINATLTTAVHVWEVPFLPYPSVVVAEADLTKTVSSAAGEVVIDCVVENPIEGTEVLLETDAAWVVPTWADGKLTLAYEANTAAVARRAKIAVSYGYYTNPFEVTLVQEKDGNAAVITLNVEVTGTQFNGIWVNVTPSDKNVTYALNQCAVEKDWETGAELETDWMAKAEDLLSYTGSATFHTGDLTNHFIKMNPSNYEWNGYDYYVYAIAVNATSEEQTDYWGNAKTVWTVSQILSEASYARTTIDVSKMPSLEWDLTKNPELVWNPTAERYDLEVVENSTVVLHFTVNNPVDGALVKLNGNSLSDYYNVVDGEPVVDNAAGTVTFNIDKFDAAKTYHFVSPTFKYTNAEEDVWGITTPSLRLTQVEAPKATELVITPDQIASINKPGSYYLADGTNQVVANEATWLKWTSLNVNLEACRVMVSTADGYKGLFQFQGDASNIEKQGFLGNATSNGEIKQVVIEAYSTYATPSFNLYYGAAKLPKDSSKVLDVAQNCTKGASQGMIGSYECFSFTCTFDIPAGNEFFAVRNDSKGATYIKSITV